ncbi:hypothetical protein FVE85_7626 [Porphyridium purpureum]|uniref:Uncharacterized protein n=1 Tax=Porphyridium purpureum TaxID=35688 RepID=A0A5J4Z7U1_PORPP|nr:hypothetical protein FVE85_7626 [Porphyridium purpureum]|eukprot:POR9589..scf295_1
MKEKRRSAGVRACARRVFVTCMPYVCVMLLAVALHTALALLAPDPGVRAALEAAEPSPQTSAVEGAPASLESGAKMASDSVDQDSLRFTQRTAGNDSTVQREGMQVLFDPCVYDPPRLPSLLAPWSTRIFRILMHALCSGIVLMYCETVSGRMHAAAAHQQQHEQSSANGAQQGQLPYQSARGGAFASKRNAWSRFGASTTGSGRRKLALRERDKDLGVASSSLSTSQQQQNASNASNNLADGSGTLSEDQLVKAPLGALLLERFTSSDFVAAVVFCVHPLHVEALLTSRSHHGMLSLSSLLCLALLCLELRDGCGRNAPATADTSSARREQAEIGNARSQDRQDDAPPDDGAGFENECLSVGLGQPSPECVNGGTRDEHSVTQAGARKMSGTGGKGARLRAASIRLLQWVLVFILATVATYYSPGGLVLVFCHLAWFEHTMMQGEEDTSLTIKPVYFFVAFVSLGTVILNWLDLQLALPGMSNFFELATFYFQIPQRLHFERSALLLETNVADMSLRAAQYFGGIEALNAPRASWFQAESWWEVIVQRRVSGLASFSRLFTPIHLSIDYSYMRKIPVSSSQLLLTWLTLSLCVREVMQVLMGSRRQWPTFQYHGLLLCMFYGLSVLSATASMLGVGGKVSSGSSGSGSMFAPLMHDTENLSVYAQLILYLRTSDHIMLHDSDLYLCCFASSVITVHLICDPALYRDQPGLSGVLSGLFSSSSVSSLSLSSSVSSSLSQRRDIMSLFSFRSLSGGRSRSEQMQHSLSFKARAVKNAAQNANQTAGAGHAGSVNSTTGSVAASAANGSLHASGTGGGGGAALGNNQNAKVGAVAASSSAMAAAGGTPASAEQNAIMRGVNGGKHAGNGNGSSKGWRERNLSALLLVLIYASRTLIRGTEWVSEHQLLASAVYQAPSSALLHWTLGSYYLAVDNARSALRHYHAAHELEPSKAGYAWSLGHAYLVNQQTSKSLLYQEKAFSGLVTRWGPAAYTPDSAYCIAHMLSVTYMYENDYESCLAVIGRILNRWPNDTIGLNNMAVCIAHKDFSSANTQFALDFLVQTFEMLQEMHEHDKVGNRLKQDAEVAAETDAVADENETYHDRRRAREQRKQDRRLAAQRSMHRSVSTSVALDALRANIFTLQRWATSLGGPRSSAMRARDTMRREKASRRGAANELSDASVSTGDTLSSISVVTLCLHVWGCASTAPAQRVLVHMVNSILFFKDAYLQAAPNAAELFRVEMVMLCTRQNCDELRPFLDVPDVLLLDVSKQPSIGAALNKGVAQTTGDLLVFQLGSTLFHPDHLTQCLDVMNQDHRIDVLRQRLVVDAAFGRVSSTGNTETMAQAEEEARTIMLQNTSKHLLAPLCVRRSVHNSVGGFPEQPGPLRSALKADHWNQLVDELFHAPILADAVLEYINKSPLPALWLQSIYVQLLRDAHATFAQSAQESVTLVPAAAYFNVQDVFAGSGKLGGVRSDASAKAAPGATAGASSALGELQDDDTLGPDVFSESEYTGRVKLSDFRAWYHQEATARPADKLFLSASEVDFCHAVIQQHKREHVRSPQLRREAIRQVLG